MTLDQIAAINAAVGFAGLAVFQLLLAMGLPLGGAAWGGKYIRLPNKLRIASLISMGVLVLASLIVLEKSGWIKILNSPIRRL